MKSILSLAVILALIASSIPVSAQQKALGPNTVDLARKAVRFAASQSSEAPQHEVDWEKFRDLKPGTEITVTRRDSQPSKRYMLAGNDSELTVLNVSDPALPPDATKTLRQIAATHPAWLANPQSGTTLELGKRAMIKPSEGLFVAGQKVAPLDQVVEQITRNDANTGAVAIKGPMSRGKKAAIWGGVGGGLYLLLLYSSLPRT